MKLLFGGFNFYSDFDAFIHNGMISLKTNTAKSIKIFKKALEMLDKFEESEDRVRREICCKSNLGFAHQKLGNYEISYNFYSESLKTALDFNNISGIVVSTKNLGDICQRLEFLEEAEAYYDTALQNVKSFEERLKILHSKGIGLILRKNYEEADELFSEIYTYALILQDKILATSALIEKGIINFHLARNAKENSQSYLDLAVKWYKNAIVSAKEHPHDYFRELECYGNLFNTAILANDAKKAINYNKEMLKILEQYPNSDYEFSTYCNLAHVYYKSNELELANNYLEKASVLFEKLITPIISDKMKIGYSNKFAPLFQLGVKINLKRKKNKQAFEYAEQSKAYSLIQLLKTSDFKPRRTNDIEFENLKLKEKYFIDKLRLAQNVTSNSTLTKTDIENVELIRRELSQIYKKMEYFDPEYVSMRVGAKPKYNELTNVISSQKKNVIVIEYFLNEDEITIFVLENERNKLTVETIEIPLKKIIEYVLLFNKEVRGYPTAKTKSHNWLKISDFLLKPIVNLIRDQNQPIVYFIPHGFLHFLPLHAMSLENKPIICEHPVAYLNNISLLKFLDKKGTGKIDSCASFGVAYEEEAKKVASLFETKAFLDIEANKRDVIKLCNNKDVIHFSCHGKFDYKNALKSKIILYDEDLFADEIFNMKLNTELVCLSACRSGMNLITKGDELIGLVRSFFYAGASSVIASLWTVEADSTEKLLLDFYSILKKNKKIDKATALQKAQVNLMKKPEYNHEYFWAPFKLFGDWQ